MNRALQTINLVGMLVLAVLCVNQWRTNRILNLEVVTLEKVRLTQIARLAEQDKALQDCATDLDAFREQLILAHASLRQTETALRTAEREIGQLTGERDQLRISVTNWANAVAERDLLLKETDERLQQLAADHNNTVTKFNQLAGDYNTVVDTLNERTRDYNALVEKYNPSARSRNPDPAD